MDRKLAPLVLLSSLLVLPLFVPVGCGGGGGGTTATGGASPSGGSPGSGGSASGGAAGGHVGTGGAAGSPGTGGAAGAAGSHATGGVGGAGGNATGGAAGNGTGGTSTGGAGGITTGGTGGAGAGGAAGAGAQTANLIVNGDAEAAVGSTDGTPVATPGWTVTGEATALQYGAPDYPAATDPGPPNRGLNFLCGGQADALSTLAQTIDVSAYATAIDAGHATYTLSGYLGGFEDQEDNVVVQITFQSATASALGTASIGPVTAEDRGSVTSLLLRSMSGAVPTGTRSIGVLVTMTRESGNNNDGYADNLSLTLGGV